MQTYYCQYINNLFFQIVRDLLWHHFHLSVICLFYRREIDFPAFPATASVQPISATIAKYVFVYLCFCVFFVFGCAIEQDLTLPAGAVPGDDLWPKS